jgi:glycosyltransferase involved in cell wall biosynthesis
MSTAPVKIAHMVLGLQVGGLEQVVLRLLERTDRSRYSPAVCVLDEPGALALELRRLDVPLWVHPRGGGLSVRAIADLSRLLCREKVALVHTHNPTPHLYGALSAVVSAVRSAAGHRFARPRVIHTKHGRNTPSARRKVFANRLSSALSDRVVAVSEDARRVVLDIERVDPAKVVTIVNGVDTCLYRPADSPIAARERLGIPPLGLHIGCVARLSAEKDHETLIEAFALLHARRRNTHLTLIGDGDRRAVLQEHAFRRGLSSAVTFAGTRSDVASLLPAFDAFALASRTEGLSLTLIEAAATGLPIVATRVGGNAEVVEHAETGLLVTPGVPALFASALESLLRRPDRRAMGARGRARAIEKFSVDRMARAYQDLYAEVLRLDG